MAKRISQAVLEDALRKAGGIPAGAAQILGCARSTVTRRIKGSERLQKLIEELEDDLGDLCESKAVAKVRSGHWPAIRFMLETKFKKRGYTRTFELEATKPLPIVFTAGQEALA